MKQAIDPALEHEIVNKATDLLSILSKKDALSIFLLAKDGLKAETDTPQRIGLTRKQYYTRLKQLVDAGLIDKSGDTYLHTTLGTFVHQKHLLELLEQIKNIKQMKMIDTLKRTSQFSEGDIANFVSKLTGTSLTSALPTVRIMTTYEDMVAVIIERIQFAKKEILLATRYLNDLVVNNILTKSKAGLDVRVVADSKLLDKYLNDSGKLLNVVDKNIPERLNVATNPYYPASNIHRRWTDVPFSVIIFDRKEVVFELVNSHDTEQFNSTLLIRDEMLAVEFIRYFETLWENSQESISDPSTNSMTNTSKLSSI